MWFRETEEEFVPRSLQDTDLYHRLKETCLNEGTLYEDPDFPANDSSIYKSSPFLTRGYPVWRRPKQICSDPKFVVDGVSRMDLHQGDLGNCWFVAASSLLTTVPELLAHVMPPGQTFKDGRYAGIFYFRFWLYGEWKEVVIDDRLPVYHDTGELIFGHNNIQKNEFWYPLLEKAYAKLYGSYEALKGGKLMDGLVDLTAGAGQVIALQSTRVPKGLFRKMYKLQKINTLMGCSIIDYRSSSSVRRLDNGLYTGHSYAITKMSKVECAGSMVKLIRLRNPWGRGEWSGTFCDKSEAWAGVSNTDINEMEIKTRDDGEFWMEFEEWKSIFTELQVCNLTPDSPLQPEDKSSWKLVKILHGAWKKGVNAGGSYGDSYSSNPKYKLAIGSTDLEDNEQKDVLVSIMQKHTRVTTPGSARYASWNATKNIAYAMYDDSSRALVNEPILCPFREVCSTHMLDCGVYWLIPYTASPNQEAEYLIRILEL